MITKANFASMSVDELWEIHEEISKLLEAKMLAEKKRLERWLISLHPAKTGRLKDLLHPARSSVAMPEEHDS
jgi:DNA-binding protein H-NS